MTGYVLIYVTAASRAQALEIARALVDERLAACANVIDGATSVYRWEGRVAEESEAVMIAKTRETLAESLIARVRELHSYQCPCIVALPITAGNPAFLDWIGSETQGPLPRPLT